MSAAEENDSTQSNQARKWAKDAKLYIYAKTGQIEESPHSAEVVEALQKLDAYKQQISSLLQTAAIWQSSMRGTRRSQTNLISALTNSNAIISAFHAKTNDDDEIDDDSKDDEKQEAEPNDTNNDEQEEPINIIDSMQRISAELAVDQQTAKQRYRDASKSLVLPLQEILDVDIRHASQMKDNYIQCKREMDNCSTSISTLNQKIEKENKSSTGSEHGNDSKYTFKNLKVGLGKLVKSGSKRDELRMKLQEATKRFSRYEASFDAAKQALLKSVQIVEEKLQRYTEEKHTTFTTVAKIDKEKFLQISQDKKQHYNKFPTLQDHADGKQVVDEKITKLTDEILQEKPSGDIAKRDTLLHILHGVAEQNGQQCLFFDSSQGIQPASKSDQDSFLTAVDVEDETAPKFVLKLTSLDGFTDDEDEKVSTTEDKVEKIKELKEALQSNVAHPIIDDIRTRLAKAHDVNVDRIVITDFYYNGFGAPYYIRDLTDNEKNKIVTEATNLNKQMDALFPNYDSCAIHPALFHHMYDISMFDERGNKTFGDSDNATYKVGPPGKERDYIQPAGWTRYGLKVLGKYGDDKWLDPFQDAGNWYRAYHGTDREAGSKIFKGAFRPGSNNAYGVGVYCTPDVNIAANYCDWRDGIIELDTTKGKKKFYFVFQVAVNPETMNNPALIPGFDPSCESENYWIAPTGADIRPYGILIKEV